MTTGTSGTVRDAVPASPAGEPVSLAAAVARIRAWRAANDWAPSRYAAEAGVSDATTRNMQDEAWAPTLRTLKKLEELIPADWQAGDPLPPVEADQKASAA